MAMIASMKDQKLGQETSTYHSLEDNVSIRVSRGVDHTRAVNEVDSTHQGDVLPHLKKEGDGGWGGGE